MQPENYFAEIEQAAFSPSNMVPGIAMTPDPSKHIPELAQRFESDQTLTSPV